MDSRKNSPVASLDEYSRATGGLEDGVSPSKDIFIDQFIIQNVGKAPINVAGVDQDGDLYQKDRSSSTVEATLDEQLRRINPFSSSLAHEVSFKWNAVNSLAVPGTVTSQADPSDLSYACAADSPTSSVSSSSTNITELMSLNLFSSNEQAKAREIPMERHNVQMQGEHSDSDCHSCEENLNSLRSDSAKESENWGTSVVRPVEEDNHFEDVMFNDIPEGGNQDFASTWDSVYTFQPIQNSFSISPKGSSAPRLSCSSVDAESSFASPLDSPLLRRPGVHQTKGSSSLLHLIDSAIQGSDRKSLQRLRRIVSGQDFASTETEESYHGEDVAWWVTDTVLAKLGLVETSHGEEQNRAPPMVLSAGAAILGGNLIPWLSTVPDRNYSISVRTKMMKSLATMLNECTRNRALCSAAGLLRVLLRSIAIIFEQNTEKADQMEDCDHTPLLDALEGLGSHSLSISDLQEWLSTAGELIPYKISFDLMCTLERAMLREETKGPAYSFELDGVSSGLLSPGEPKWPFANGYAFVTWLYSENFSDGSRAPDVANKGKQMLSLLTDTASDELKGEEFAQTSQLFTFLSSEKQGIEAYFKNRFLVIETTSEKGRKSSVCFAHEFNLRRWYFVGLEHTHKQNVWGGAENEVRLYIDGVLSETKLLELPRISKALESCCIGANPHVAQARSKSRNLGLLSCIQFGPFYIFKEPIGQVKMALLAGRGADALPTFGNEVSAISQLQVRKSSGEESAVLGREIQGQLYVLYHPKLLAKRSCMDVSPSGTLGKHRRHAEVLGHVFVVSRTHPLTSLWALAEGGPMALLPLTVGFLDRSTLQPCFPDSTISAGAALLSISIFRIVALALDYGKIAEEMNAPQLLAHLLRHLLCVPWERKIELLSSVISLSLAFNKDPVLKVQIFKYVLLNLKIWCLCPPEIQKVYLSSLADIVVTDEATMRDANGVQLLLDGCRSCYWSIPEVDSVWVLDERSCRSDLQLNRLVDELLIVVELLMNTAQRSTLAANIHSLVQFILGCPQRHQVSRVLQLLCRLVRQPNLSKAALFAELLLKDRILEVLLVLLQRETGEGTGVTHQEIDVKLEVTKESQFKSLVEKGNLKSTENGIEHAATTYLFDMTGELEENRRSSRVSFEEDSPEHDMLQSRNTDAGDKGYLRHDLEISSRSADIVIAIINFLGAMLFGGYLQLPNIFELSSSNPLIFSASQETVKDLAPELESGIWLVYALQNAFQIAPCLLLTEDVFTAVLAAVVGSEATSLSTQDKISMWSSNHWYQNFELLMAILRSLPYASLQIQLRVLQDIFILASTCSENRSRLTSMTEWPDWILEILISNFEGKSRASSNKSARFQDVEDVIYSILMIILQYSMRIEHGWKDIEAVIHCAEWLAILGGSKIGEERIRREKSLPKFKRRLLENLLDFSVTELRKQAENAAAVAAAVAAGNSNANVAKAEAEAAALKSLPLFRNSLVLLMFVEDHLRLESNSACNSTKGSQLGIGLESEVSTALAEPYESVRCALASYGSYGLDMAESWTFRSQLFQGVGLPGGSAFGGGGKNLETWNLVMERGGTGEWAELSLVNKSIEMLEVLLINVSDCGGGSGVGGGAGSLQSLQQLLDNDQTFYAIFRMVLLALREEEEAGNLESFMSKHVLSPSQIQIFTVADSRKPTATRAKEILLQRILAPLLTKEITESRRQRALVALCILYSEVWHSISTERKILRKQYIDAIVPLLIRLLRKWRPFLNGIYEGSYEMTCNNGSSPVTVEDMSTLLDASSEEAALTLISPFWAAAFASPPAAMALAIAAAGVSEGETPVPSVFCSDQRGSHVERSSLRLFSFSNLLRSTDTSFKPPSMWNRKTSEMFSVSQEREHKIDSFQAFRTAKLESSVQRRAVSDRERARRWDIIKAMDLIWLDCFNSAGEMVTQSVSHASESNSKWSMSLWRAVKPIQERLLEEVERRVRTSAEDDNASLSGANAWRSFVQQLLETETLLGPVLK